MTNFRTIIVPEAVKCIYAEDQTVFAVVQQLQTVACSQKMSLRELIESIQAHLLEMPLTTQVGEHSVTIENKIIMSFNK